jgi:hypothetical protein
MSSAPPKSDFAAIQETISGMQKASRRSVPLFVVGILSTLISAGVAAYFIINLSTDLDKARQSLQASRVALALAQIQLSQTKSILQESNNKFDTKESAKNLELISNISSTQKELKSASKSISMAAINIVSTKQESLTIGFSGDWIDEYGSKYRVRQQGTKFLYDVAFPSGALGKATGAAKGASASYKVWDDVDRKFECSAKLLGTSLQIIEKCVDERGQQSTVTLTRF